MQAQGIAELIGGRSVITDQAFGPGTILADIGCGTGVVTGDLATAHRAATVYGVDLTPVPEQAPKLPNIVYITGNIRDLVDSDARFSAGSLDFVFQRLLIAGMTDWPRHVRDVYKTLKPGGRVEMQDVSYDCFQYGKRINTDHSWAAAFYEIFASKGLDYEVGKNLGTYLKEAGFVDVEVQAFRYPFGEWLTSERPETALIGRHNEQYLPAVMGRMLRRLGRDHASQSEVQRWSEECERTLKLDGIEWQYFVVTARKPEAEAS